jgi:hypothetical protein
LHALQATMPGPLLDRHTPPDLIVVPPPGAAEKAQLCAAGARPGPKSQVVMAGLALSSASRRATSATAACLGVDVKVISTPPCIFYVENH